jgi:uncharacterized FlaG/YvyC family protein
MTKNDLVQLKKNEALNKIRKIFNPKIPFSYDQWSDESGIEQKGREVENIIERLENELKLINKVK